MLHCGALAFIHSNKLRVAVGRHAACPGGGGPAYQALKPPRPTFPVRKCPH
jgi:hypothetical protein